VSDAPSRLVALDLDERGLARVTLDSPATRNALSPALLADLGARIAEANERGARAIVLSGAGGVFAAGADLRELASRSEWTSYAGLAQRTYDAIEGSPAPVVAVIEGVAFGGAMELALACHLRVAARTARMGLPEVSLGILPGAGGTQRLTAVVGRGRALELIVTARLIDGEEALRFGLVAAAVDADELAAAGDALAERILANAPHAVRLAKDAVLLATPTESGLAFERAAQALLFTQPERHERVGGRIAQLDARRRQDSQQEVPRP
jgi:enoyl-CoA hydratase/carnithine racemase